MRHSLNFERIHSCNHTISTGVLPLCGTVKPFCTRLHTCSHCHFALTLVHCCRYGPDKGSSSNFAAQFDPTGTAWRPLKDVSNTAAAIGALSAIAVMSVLLHSFIWTAVFAALSMNVKPFDNVQYAKVCTMCISEPYHL
jgi:hypothetical protein